MEQRQLKKINFVTIYNAISRDLNHEKGLSGGDRIVIELARRWKNYFQTFEIVTCSSGKKIVEDNLSEGRKIKITTIHTPSSYYSNILKLYLYKTVKGMHLFIKKPLSDNVYLFTSSDFLPDVIPATIAKMRNKKIYWIAGFYLFAPHPFSKDSPYTGTKLRIRGFLYYYTQKIKMSQNINYLQISHDFKNKIIIYDDVTIEHI